MADAKADQWAANRYTDPARPPLVGPYGEAAWDGSRWRVRATDDGREFLGRWLSDWPWPGSLVFSVYPASVMAALDRGLSYDDIGQECVKGYLRAVARFDPARGVRFGTYAAWWGRAELNRSRGWGRELAVGNLSAAPDPEEGVRGPLSDIEGRVGDALRFLPERSRRVVEMRFGFGGRPPMTQLAVAAELGVTRTRVWQIEQGALARLADVLRPLRAEVTG